MMNRILPAALVLFTITLMAYAYTHATGHAQEDPRRSLSPQGIPASTRSVPLPESLNTKTSKVSQQGWIQFDKCPVFATESVELPSQDAGVIASLDVVENDEVQAGQAIGKLDGRLVELEKSVTGLQVQVATAEAQDESEIKLATAFLEEAELQAEISEEMNNKGTGSPSDVRQKQLAVSQAKVRLTQSKALKVQKELKAKLAQASLVVSQQKIERLVLKSPIDGTVTHLNHRPGEWVQAGAPIVKIIRLDELRIDCFVDIDQLDPARLVGMPIKVISKRGVQETLFAGKISSYDPDVSSAGKIRVHAIVQNQKIGNHWQLLPGMSVSMQMQKPQ